MRTRSRGGQVMEVMEEVTEVMEEDMEVMEVMEEDMEVRKGSQTCPELRRRLQESSTGSEIAETGWRHPQG